MKQIGWCFLLLSLVCASTWIWQKTQAASRSSRTDPISALILANRIRTVPFVGAHDQLGHHYQAELLLEYHLEDRLLRSWITDPMQSTQRSRIEISLANRCPGSRLPVFIDPRHPERIALKSNPGYPDASTTLPGILALGFAFFGALFVRLPRKSQHTADEVVYLS